MPVMVLVPQSTRCTTRLPVWALLLGLLPPAVALGQNPVRLAAETTFHKEPGGVLLVTLARGAPVVPNRTRGEWTEVTIESWIWSRSVEATNRDGFNLTVSARNGENLRARPDGTIIGRAVYAALFDRVSTQGGWTRVRRTGWIAASTLPGSTGASSNATSRSPADSAAPTAAAPANQVSPPEQPFPATGLVQGTQLAVVPSGQPVVELLRPADGRVIERQGDWAKVRIEGWVRAADLADPTVAEVPKITAEDLRRDPTRFIGQTVDWRLQFISVQTADELRSELPLGQPYLLTRGPLPEAGFVYVVVTREQAQRFRQMAPLDEFEARAVIKAAKTRYLPNPVIELREIP